MAGLQVEPTYRSVLLVLEEIPPNPGEQQPLSHSGGAQADTEQFLTRAGMPGLVLQCLICFQSHSQPAAHVLLLL